MERLQRFQIKMERFIASRLALQEMPNEILHTEGKYYQVEVQIYKMKWKTLEMANMWVNIYDHLNLFFKF